MYEILTLKDKKLKLKKSGYRLLFKIEAEF